MIQHDKTFIRAMDFVKNSQKTHPGISNIYVFTSVDKDGNITDEKYGMNLMTNTGFASVYQSGSTFTPSNSLKLFVGSGTSPTAITDTQIETVCFNGLGATNTNTTKDYKYPMYYAAGINPGEGLITLISRFMICEYPFNIDNFPSDTRIEEYGIGTAWNNLWTHSRIFSNDGSRSNIIKRPNEKLIITVYMCLSFYESLIQNGWSNDVYTMITTAQVMFHRMFESNIYTYKRDNTIYNRQNYSYTDGNHTIDSSQENVYMNSTVLGSFVLNDGSGTNSGYFDGFMYKTDGMIILEPAFLGQPESLVLTDYRSNKPWDREGFSYKFGRYPDSDYNKNQYPSITHLITAEAYLYDWKTNNWDIQLNVYNPSNKLYSDTPAQSNCGLPIYFWDGREVVEMYVYQNIRPDDPIVSITVGSLSVYATDSYWDFDTWIFIDNFNQIPQSAQQKRFWITASNIAGNSLKFTRASDTFQLLEQGGTTIADNGYEEYHNFGSVMKVHNICDNYAYHWFMLDNKVYFPNSQYSITVGNAGDTESMTYGKWLITFNSVNNSVIVTDTGKQDPSMIVSTTETLPFTSNVNVYTQCYRTDSGTGVICVQSIKSGVEECVIIDIRGSVFSSHKHAWKMACCIWGTSKIAYVPAGSSDMNVYIYDVRTGAVSGSAIPIPSSLTDVHLMYGHSDGTTDLVWCMDKSSHAFVVDVSNESSRTPVEYTDPINYTSGFNAIKFTSVDELFIIYRSSDYATGYGKKIFYYKMDDPTNPSDIYDFEISSSYLYGRLNVDLRYSYKTTVNGVTHGALVLSLCIGMSNWFGDFNGVRMQIIDFGRYLRTGEVIRYYADVGSSFGFIPYGENYIYQSNITGDNPHAVWIKTPIPNWLPIKLVGTTDTVTAFNNIKNVTNKQWMVTYTNRPTYGDGSANSNGIPPGKPLAQTDSNGTIIGWS